MGIINYLNFSVLSYNRFFKIVIVCGICTGSKKIRIDHIEDLALFAICEKFYQIFGANPELIAHCINCMISP